MTHMMIEDGLQAEIEAARMGMSRDLEAQPMVTRAVIAATRERVVQAFPGSGVDERTLLIHIVASLTLSLESEADS